VVSVPVRSVSVATSQKIVSAQPNLADANRPPDAVTAPHGRTPGLDRGSPATRHIPSSDKNALLHFWRITHATADMLAAWELND
jgi:hypothetical protein